jgi:DNA-binding transcriptional MerR regulator
VPLPDPTATFTLAALAAEAATRMDGAPDERTLRYYQTLGILDRPLRYDGRQAVYGYRHLLQALAVRALQAQGHTLAQVQRALAGASTDALAAAVAESIGEHVPAPAPRALRAFELAPGVHLTIDPAHVADPDALVARLARLLSSGGLP